MAEKSGIQISSPFELYSGAANIDTRYGPWTSVANANAGINAARREEGLTVGIISGSTVTEYWYNGGTADIDLVAKAAAGVSAVLAGSGMTVTGGDTVVLGGTATGDITIDTLTNTVKFTIGDVTKGALEVENTTAGVEYAKLTGYNSSASVSFQVGGANGLLVTDGRATKKGIEYTGIDGTGFTSDSLIHWGFAQTKIGAQSVDALVTTPTATEDGYAIVWNDTNNEYELAAQTGSVTANDDDIGKASGGAIVNAQIYSSTAGDLDLGDGTLAGDRTIYATGSDSTPDLILKTKGSGTNGGEVIIDSDSTIKRLRMGNSTSGVRFTSVFEGNSSSDLYQQFIQNGSGAVYHWLRNSGTGDAYSAFSSTGIAFSAGVDYSKLQFKISSNGSLGDSNERFIIDLNDNIGFNGSSFADMEGGIFVGGATVNPTTNPTGGVLVYSNAADDHKPYVRTPSGNVYDLTAGTGGSGAFSTDGSTQISPSTAIVLDHASNNEIALDLSGTVNKAAGTSTWLYADVTTTTALTDFVHLLDDSVSKFRISSAGDVYMNGNDLVFDTDEDTFLRSIGNNVYGYANGALIYSFGDVGTPYFAVSADTQVSGDFEILSGTLGVGTSASSTTLILAEGTDSSAHTVSLGPPSFHTASTYLKNEDQTTLETGAYQFFSTYGTNTTEQVSYIAALSYSNTESALVFGTNNAGTVTEQMRLNADGELTVANYVFDADQTVGAGQDNYILTYDNGTGKISLEASASVSAGVDHEVQISDGAGGFVASNLFCDDSTADVTLGTVSLAGTSRSITATGSNSTVALNLSGKTNSSTVRANGIFAVNSTSSTTTHDWQESEVTKARAQYNFTTNNLKFQVTDSGALNDSFELIGTTGNFKALAHVELDEAKNIITGTTTGSTFGTTTSQKLAFYGSTAIIQPSGTGETTGFTAGTGTGVNDDSTFTGNVGATAYRVNDIVKALKNLGLLAS